MLIALYVVLGILGYLFMAAFCASRHHAIRSAQCRYENCWSVNWCGHCCFSVWVMGVFWPLGWVALAGIRAGGGGAKESRVNRRHQKELDEAQHKLELARLERKAIQELEAAVQ